MATVRFSEELKSEIRKNADRKMQPAVDRAYATRPDNSWGSRIYNTMFSEYMPSLQTLPNEWFQMVEGFNVTKVGDTKADLEFKLGFEVKWPQSIPTTEYCEKCNEYYYGSKRVKLTDNEVWTEFKQEVVAYNERVAQAKARQKEFIDMVLQIINAYTTLAPALKAWPALWELIPEEYKERHRKVVVKEKKEIELDVDLNKLTAMSAAAKFGV
jgi:hypothetical protein